MPERPKYSRWRRLPAFFRSGEFKMPDPREEEQRVSLYIPGLMLDLAEEQANRAGAPTVQEYCAELLQRAIEGEHAREQVADLEARRGPLAGLHEIASDPEYLAEWSARTGGRDPVAFREPSDGSVPLGLGDLDAPAIPVRMPITPERAVYASPAEVVLRHAAVEGDDPQAFLACMRRGEPPPLARVAELAQALQTLEDELQTVPVIDRRLAYALHRLAFEAQLLHTDAWPGSFDEWAVETLRAIQEYVDRILSGQDIRYYRSSAPPETPH
ncbi:MAG: hypothetical protein P4L84_16285 [Isosphaeraceae bacterium]|nr:hypothetical protein [Isosphaeraceae bacterium]